jgi:hypothetical protein
MSWSHGGHAVLPAPDRADGILMTLLAVFVALVLSLAGEFGTSRGADREVMTPAELRRMRDTRIALCLSLAGVGACVGGLFWATPVSASVAVFVFVIALGARVVVLLRIDLGRFQPPWRRLLIWGGSTMAVLLLAFLVVIPRLRGSSELAGPQKGPFEISGTTCGDGSCTLNECGRPKKCGSQRIGRLGAGRKVAIECQIKGGKVKTPDGRHFSYIWDRLEPRVFVSDLFIEGTRFNRFTVALPRCRQSEGAT